MIPTLSGRIQTRILLLLVVGVPVTALFGWIWAGAGPAGPAIGMFLMFLVTVNALGLLLDPVYIFLQTTRWERDWPLAYQVFFSVAEFAAVLALAMAGWVPWLAAMGPGGDAGITIGTAMLHFACVFVPSFAVMVGVLPVLLIRWRYKGGQLGRL